YGGAIGYIDFRGNLDMCICIRTAIKKGDDIYVQAGGGIVLDSVSENEYMETENKAKAVLRALAMSEGELE
ncbi:anthranilate synthase component I, partial [Klebsiella pneumoniae]|nr:anthranilate synthase component I [Klebsiella pneumoniae]